MNTIKNDIKKILNDAAAIFNLSASLSQQRFFILSGFLGVFAASFFFDTDIRSLIHLLRREFFDHLFSLFHWYGKPYLTLTTICILYGGGFILSKHAVRITGVKTFEAFAFSGIIVTILKSLFGRWRPYAEHGNLSFTFFTLGPNDHLSLPSGDAAIAFAYSTILAGAINNKIWKWMWYLFAVITSVGRLYHDQHWLSDVVLASGIAVWVGIFINSKHRDR